MAAHWMQYYKPFRPTFMSLSFSSRHSLTEVWLKQDECTFLTDYQLFDSLDPNARWSVVFWMLVNTQEVLGHVRPEYVRVQRLGEAVDCSFWPLPPKVQRRGTSTAASAGRKKRQKRHQRAPAGLQRRLPRTQQGLGRRQQGLTQGSRQETRIRRLPMRWLTATVRRRQRQISWPWKFFWTSSLPSCEKMAKRKIELLVPKINPSLMRQRPKSTCQRSRRHLLEKRQHHLKLRPWLGTLSREAGTCGG